MTLKTEEAKLREEIEKEEEKEVNSPKDIIKYEIAKAKLQQLLADKKMFKDAVEETFGYLIAGSYTPEQLLMFTKFRQELLKTLGIQEED